jgi:hypothetical protein
MTSGGKLILKGSVTVDSAQAHLYAGTGTIQLDSSFAQTIPAGTYDNLTLSGSGTKTASGAITVVGDLNNSATLDMAGYTLTLGTTTINNGTVRFSGASNGMPVGTTGTVEYYGTGQTVATGTYTTLILNNAATFTAAGDITATTLAVGGNPSTLAAILDMAGYTLAWTYIDNSHGTIRFFGATNGQAINSGTIEYLGASPTVAGGTYNNLTLNINSGDAHLGGSSIVNGTLHLGACNILLGTSNLTLGGTVTGAAASSCVVTNGSGYVQRSIADAGSFTFPIGPSTTTYNPVTLTNKTGSTCPYTARVEVGDNPTTPDSTQAGNQTWTLTGNATGGPGVDLAFTWLTSEAGVNITPGSAVAWEHNGTAWVQAGGTTATGTPNVTTVTGMGNLSPWIIGNPNALPIELASFTANAVSNTVTLEWMTISETNTLGFYVERGSSKTGPFTEVSSLIAGAGTSTAQHNYSYADNSVSSGTYYYRLHQLDKNGAGSYSSVITVTVSGVLGVDDKRPLPTEFALHPNYPNPFNPSTVINYELPRAAYVRLVVYDMLGREVATIVNGAQEAGYKSVEFRSANIPSGIYTYRLSAGTFVEVKKMVLMK